MLPIIEIYPELIAAITHNPIVLLQAPPGAGKSTWLPLQLMRDGHFKRIVMLEPRRIAARNIAQFLAQQQNESLGESIGLRIRHEKKVSSNTRLEIVTEGMLTRMLQEDPELSGVDCIIFDEFHERSLNADTALAFALESQAAFREDLKVLIMSATLDGDQISKKLNCPIIESQGRSFPISEYYYPLRDERQWLEHIPPLIEKALKEQTGSCLVFLPGQKEIQYVQRALTDLPNDCDVAMLYGEQDKALQQQAIAPAPTGRRKIVLATNVAETSLTIEGIRIVIDSGKARRASFNLNTGVTELTTVNISMASAIQRAGRAGRLEAGVVYRLGSEEYFKRREAHDTPEILRSDIANVLLEAKLWGSDITSLPLIDQPTSAQVDQAHTLLKLLDAVDENSKLTDCGKALSQFGTDIRFAHMLFKAQRLSEKHPTIVITAAYLLALLESRVQHDADLMQALSAQAYKAHPAFKTLLQFWCKRLHCNANDKPDTELIPLLLALAYPDRLAKRRGKGFLMANGAGIEARDDVWPKADYLAIAELGGINGTRIFSAVAFDIDSLKNDLPHLFSEKKVVEFDEKTGRFIQEQRVLLGELTINAKPISGSIDDAARNSVWIQLVEKKGLSLFNAWSTNPADGEDNACIQWAIRLELANRFYPAEFKAWNEASLIKNADQWLSPHLTGINTLEQLKKMDLFSALQSLLDWNQQQRLNAILPERIEVPTGSMIRVSYQSNGPAKLSVRMQEMFGLSHTPKLCDGKLSLLMDLLSPAHRSLQLTEDLARFWQGSYKEVQKEMKGRYPKHFWPDDPANAKPTTKVKNKM